MRILIAALLLTGGFPLAAGADELNAQSVMETVVAREQARTAGSPRYLIKLEGSSIAPTKAISILEKVSDRLGYWHMPPDFVKMRLWAGDQGDVPEQFANSPYAPDYDAIERQTYESLTIVELAAIMASGLAMGQIVDAIQNGGGESSLPSGALDVPGNGGALVVGAAQFFGAGLADRDRELIRQYFGSDEEARQVLDNMARFGEEAELMDVHQIGGRDAHFLLATDLGIRLQSTETEFLTLTGGGDDQAAGVTRNYTINDVGIWVDAETFVITGMRMVGEFDRPKKGEPKHFVIEQLLSDFRTVPGTRILLPCKRLMSVSFSEEDSPKVRQLREALAQVEQQMAQMQGMVAAGQISQSQFEMIQAQMEATIGPQQAQIEALTRGATLAADMNLSKVATAESVDELRRGIAILGGAPAGSPFVASAGTPADFTVTPNEFCT